jgi:hypothetical protein
MGIVSIGVLILLTINVATLSGLTLAPNSTAAPPHVSGNPPGVNIGILKDPSGTYKMKYLANGEVLIDILRNY